MAPLFGLFGKKATKAKDLVCGMDVDPAKTQWMSSHDGSSYYFCGKSCKDAFDADPAKYVGGGQGSMSQHQGHR